MELFETWVVPFWDSGLREMEHKNETDGKHRWEKIFFATCCYNLVFAFLNIPHWPWDWINAEKVQIHYPKKKKNTKSGIHWWKLLRFGLKLIWILCWDEVLRWKLGSCTPNSPLASQSLEFRLADFGHKYGLYQPNDGFGNSNFEIRNPHVWRMQCWFVNWVS